MSGDLRGGLGRIGRTLGRTGTGRGTLEEVWDGSTDPRGGPGNPRRSPERVGGPLVRSGKGRGPSGRSGTGRGTLGEVRDESGDPRGGPERVEGLSERFGTGRWTIREF